MMPRELTYPAQNPAWLVEELAARVARLTVSHRDPERFHLEKDDIAHSLRCLADELQAMQGRQA